MRNNIFKKIFILAAAVTIGLTAGAAKNNGGVGITDAKMTRNGALMTVNMKLTFDTLKVKSNGATVIQPMIVNGADTLRLETVGVYGRSSWYTAIRNDRMPLGGPQSETLRYKKRMPAYNYTRVVDFAPWMDGAELIVDQTAYGCAGCDKGTKETADIADYHNIRYTPTFIYQAVVAEEVKTRELSGRAYVDFPVNLIVIYPDYRRNSIELAKIIATIDSVRNDKDVTVDRITIKGFASPEGPYDNNIRLAKGRTAALKDYVNTLYKFPADFIQTSYEPEDWEGLRNFVEGSNIENRQGILDIIDSDLAPDPKNTKIQTTYPVQYKWLLDNIYPGLRHSDYTIQYTVRSFTDPVEIRELVKIAPQKLSLSEFYVAVQGLEPGSPEYNEIFETAVRMYPDVPAANLNAANALMQRGDTERAAQYLAKAGQSPEANYARGVLQAMNENYAGAIDLMQRAIDGGLKVDASILENLRQAAHYLE